MIIWITGFSGAGKSSIAQALILQLEESGNFQKVVMLDGDAVRSAIDDPHTGHDRQSRLKNAYRICRLAKLLEQQGCTVIVATMSLFHEIHAWNRSNFSDYVEVFIQVDTQVLETRNAGNLYSNAAAGVIKDVVGVDLAGEIPIQPDLVLKNNQLISDFDPLALEIMQLVTTRSTVLLS